MQIVPNSTPQTLKPFSEPSTTSFKSPVSQQVNDAHPLEQRIRNWSDQEDKLKSDLLKTSFGAAEPLRRAMEQQIVNQSFVPQCVGGGSNLSLDILRNNDARISWEDVYKEDTQLDFHAELEKRMHLGRGI